MCLWNTVYDFLNVEINIILNIKRLMIVEKPQFNLYSSQKNRFVLLL